MTQASFAAVHYKLLKPMSTQIPTRTAVNCQLVLLGQFQSKPCFNHRLANVHKKIATETAAGHLGCELRFNTPV